MRLDVLGDLQITVAGEARAPDLPQRRIAVLLASVALSTQPIAQSELIDRLWGRRATALADPPGSLRNLVSNARVKALEGYGDALHNSKTDRTVALVRDIVTTDVDQLRASASGSCSPEEVAAALRLVRGPLLGSFDGKEFPWLDEQGRPEAVELMVAAVRSHTNWPTGTARRVVSDFLRRPQGTLFDAVAAALADAAPAAPASEPVLPPALPAPTKRPSAERPPRTWRRAALAVSAVTAVAAAIVLVIILPGNGPEPPSGSTTMGARVVTGPTLSITSITPPPGATVALGMRGINRTYRPRWGTTVTADATDTLEFEAAVENRAGERLENLLLLVSCTVFCSGGSSQRLALRTSIATDRGAVLATSNRVLVAGQSGGLQEFVLGDRFGVFLSEISDSGIGASSEVTQWTGRVRAHPPTDRIVGVFRIGALDAGATRRLRFRASWDVGDTGQLSSTSSDVRVGAGRWQARSAVSPGQIVTIGTGLANVAYSHPWTARVRVRFVPNRAAGTVDVITNASLADGHDQGGPQPTGAITLQSAGAGPIDLQIVPGTTELWGHCRPGVCARDGRDEIRLPDGLADEGIEVGPLGGFVPRDRQHGTQFTRYLVFKARVQLLTDSGDEDADRPESAVP